MVFQIYLKAPNLQTGVGPVIKFSVKNTLFILMTRQQMTEYYFPK